MVGGYRDDSGCSRILNVWFKCSLKRRLVAPLDKISRFASELDEIDLFVLWARDLRYRDRGPDIHAARPAHSTLVSRCLVLAGYTASPISFTARASSDSLIA